MTKRFIVTITSGYPDKITAFRFKVTEEETTSIRDQLRESALQTGLSNDYLYFETIGKKEHWIYLRIIRMVSINLDES